MNLTDSIDGPLGYALNSIGQDLVVIPKRYMHDGSKLVAASIRFRVLKSRTALPSNGPSFIIIYQRGDLMPIDTPQGKLCFWAICSGQFPLPATPAAYYNGGDPQDLVATNFLPDNPTISTADYYYMIALTGESGGNPDGAPLPRNMFHSITMTFEVQDMRPE
ncbi:hypothetical protein LZC95_08100 [Pendulispora brunnea]|uniref:Uncharacterized protein n=1 Tax=Pendulispora brunnea TaxID=2905690 RepID=A0ABZ2KDM1_9BACT